MRAIYACIGVMYRCIFIDIYIYTYIWDTSCFRVARLRFTSGFGYRCKDLWGLTTNQKSNGKERGKRLGS